MFLSWKKIMLAAGNLRLYNAEVVVDGFWSCVRQNMRIDFFFLLKAVPVGFEFCLLVGLLRKQNA